jgi:hypothetical protein
VDARVAPPDEHLGLSLAAARLLKSGVNVAVLRAE